MLPPYLIVVEEVLPAVRKKLAIQLKRSGLSQGEIAGKLGTSQAMVSRYLREEREVPKSLRDTVDRITGDLTVAALAGETLSELTDRFSSAVERTMEEGLMKERYEERFFSPPPSSCFGPHRTGENRISVLRDLETSIQYLMSHPIPDLIPALKVNIAYAIPGARDPTSVASIPGRLPDIRGRIQQTRAPEFGVSRHLSAVLLASMSSDPLKRAAMNLAYDHSVREALDSMDLQKKTLERSGTDPLDVLSVEGPGEDGVVVDPGDFGIEPCLYLIGRTPLEISSRAHKLQLVLDERRKEVTDPERGGEEG